MPIRLVVIDDSDVMVLGLCAVLNEDHRLHVVGTGQTLQDLLRIVRASPPDAIVLNEWFHNTDLLAVIDEVRVAVPSARLIVTSVLSDGLHIRDLLASGVKGYLCKRDRLRDVLIPAIETVMANRPYLSPTANMNYLLALQSPLRDWQLDPESRQVLRLISQGMHVAEIAETLAIPIGRVYRVRRKLRQRFNVSTNEHLVMRAAAEGFAYQVY